MLDNVYHQAKSIFIDSLSLDKEQLNEIIKQRCGDNVTLYERVMELHHQDLKHSKSTLATENSVSQNLFKTNFIDPLQQTFGNYQIIDLIGCGGMGDVFLASRSDGEYRKNVAIKVGTFQLQSDLHQSRFLLERQLFAGLEHPAICRMLDGGTTDYGTPYIIMEFIDGMPITEYCNEQELSTNERINLFLKVCDGIQFAHSHSIIHRDIKPANILVNKQGEPKIIDFGIASLDTPSSQGDEGSNTPKMFTPNFASPEQIKGLKLSTGSDIYSLGVTLYELLTKKRPFELSSLQPNEYDKELKKEHSYIGEDYKKSWLKRKLRNKNFRLEDVNAIVTKAMSYDVSKRYQSVTQLRSDLQCFLNHQPVSVNPPGLFHRFSLWRLRHKFASLMLIFSAILVIFSFTLLTFKNNQLATERDIANTQSLRAQAISSLLTSAFKQVDPYNANGQSKSAQEVLVVASQQLVEKEFSPELESSLHNTLGEVFLNMSSYSEAKQHFNKVLSIINSSDFSQKYSSIGTTLTSLGFTELGLGNIESAQHFAEKALAVAPQSTNPTLLANINYLQGRIYQHQAKWEEAISSHIKANSLYIASTSQIESSTLQNNIFLAKAQISNRSYAVAEKLLLKLRVQLTEKRLTMSPDFAEVEAAMALLYWFQDRWLESEVLLERQLTRVTKLYGMFSDLHADTAGMMAMTKLQLAKTDDAQKYHKLAIEITTQKYGDEHVKLIGLLINYGNLLQNLEKYSAAEPILKQALALSTAHHGRNHDTTGYAKWTLGIITGRLKDLEKSIFLMKEAEQLFQAKYDKAEYPIAEIKLSIGVALLYSQKFLHAEQYLLACIELNIQRENVNKKMLKQSIKYLKQIYTQISQPEKIGSVEQLVSDFI